MSIELIYSLIAIILVSFISLVGVLVLSLEKNSFAKILKFIVAFSAGSLLATAFFDLIPESLYILNSLSFVLVGIILFFMLEALVHWHHHHEKDCEDCLKPVVHLNLIGDGVHNLIDGVIIAASFIASIPTGVITTIAIMLHEIPQEIGDFGILVNGGLSKRKAILFNFISSLFAILGGILSFFFISSFEWILPYIILVAAGGFIYIATADLFPELHMEENRGRIILQIIAFLLGIGLIWLILLLF